MNSSHQGRPSPTYTSVLLKACRSILPSFLKFNSFSRKSIHAFIDHADHTSAQTEAASNLWCIVCVYLHNIMMMCVRVYIVSMPQIISGRTLNWMNLLTVSISFCFFDYVLFVWMTLYVLFVWINLCVLFVWMTLCWTTGQPRAEGHCVWTLYEV
jgi:hypothetical protein